jgi:hypothetical protein
VEDDIRKADPASHHRRGHGGRTAEDRHEDGRVMQEAIRLLDY